MAQFAFEMHCQQTLLTCCYDSGMLVCSLSSLSLLLASSWDTVVHNKLEKQILPCSATAEHSWSLCSHEVSPEPETDVNALACFQLEMFKAIRRIQLPPVYEHQHRKDLMGLANRSESEAVRREAGRLNRIMRRKMDQRNAAIG